VITTRCRINGLPNLKTKQEKAFEEFKNEKNINYISINTVVNFDDLADYFKLERFDSTSSPIHQINVFPRADVRATVRGALLARMQGTTASQHRRLIFEEKNGIGPKINQKDALNKE